MQNQIRHRKTRRLIRFSTVCLQKFLLKFEFKTKSTTQQMDSMGKYNRCLWAMMLLDTFRLPSACREKSHSLCMLDKHTCFYCRLLTFYKITFFRKKKHSLGTLSECQTVWTQIRIDVLSVLIWVQTVCKGYQQTIQVATGNIPASIQSRATFGPSAKRHSDGVSLAGR